MDASSILLILMAVIGFFVLAAILLIPVYLFLRREKIASEHWTQETLARRIRETPPSPNGAAQHNPASQEKPGV